MRLDIEKIFGFVSEAEVNAYVRKGEEANVALHAKTGKGSDFLGWVNLPSSIGQGEIDAVNEAARALCDDTDIVVVIGIGGSYLGAKAVTEALGHNFDGLRTSRTAPHILFAGQNISADYAHDLMDVMSGKKVSCIVISKSGTTTEPAIAFRIVKNFIEQRFGKHEAKRRIVAITDKERGALRTLAAQEGYTTFVIPDDVGGRYSVLTPVGLLPIACAGCDIAELVRGARLAEARMANSSNNLAVRYAAVRNALYAKGKRVEILANFEPKLHFFTEWWKQLYGESEGKDGKGIFPAGTDFTTDLHSMGQYIQDGERMLFETVISVEQSRHNVCVPFDTDNLDGLNFLAEKSLSYVNSMAEKGTQLAHVDGGVPNIHISITKLDEPSLGELIYFFELACGISGYLLGVNPFDQPGVEAYKKNMFALLNKPGYEKASEEIRKKI